MNCELYHVENLALDSECKIELKYYLTSTIIYDIDNKSYTVFGIKIDKERSGTLEESVCENYLSKEKEVLSNILGIISKGKVTPVSLIEVLHNFMF